MLLVVLNRLQLPCDSNLPISFYCEFFHQAEEIYAYGVARFGNSSWMHLLRAQFCYFYNENKTVALSHLARAESRSPQLDEAFSIYFLRKSAHESISGGDGSTDIIACTNSH